jgi:hypothetical protein
LAGRVKARIVAPMTTGITASPASSPWLPSLSTV